MRFLVAAEGSTLSDPVSKRFGHAAFHLVVDGENPEILEALKHDHNLPGHGIGRFSGWNLDGVIAGNMGPEAFQDLALHRLKVYIVRGTTVQQAILQVVSGEIPAANGPTMKRSIHEHGPGHGGERKHRSK